MGFDAAYEQKKMTPADAAGLVRDGDTIVVPTGVGEPPALFVTKNNFRNVPQGLINDDPLRAIGLAQPPQFFFKQS